MATEECYDSHELVNAGQETQDESVLVWGGDIALEIEYEDGSYDDNSPQQPCFNTGKSRSYSGYSGMAAQLTTPQVSQTQCNQKVHLSLACYIVSSCDKVNMMQHKCMYHPVWATQGLQLRSICY